MSPDAPYPRAWYARHPLLVGHDLLGSYLVVDREGGRVVARITEVEAYGGLLDGASHATMYRVGRQSLEFDAGVLYMQLSYGLHTMTNIVAHPPGGLGAVLLRAAEDPVEGLEIARARRASRFTNLLVGPGNLSQGAGTRLSDTLAPLDGSHDLTIVPGPAPAEIRASPRIGITKAVEAQWRLFDAGSRFVSRHRRGDVVSAADLPRLLAHLPPVS